MTHYEIIVNSTEVRRHNGQCAYGEWIPLEDCLSTEVIEEVAGEIISAMFRDMRQEARSGNTDESGMVEVGGQMWVYSR